MKRFLPFLILALVAGCSHPTRTAPTQAGGSEAHFTRQQVVRNREALALTAAYRTKMGIGTPTTRPGRPADVGRLRRIALEKHRPELVRAGPVIQGVDDLPSAYDHTASKETR